MSPTGSKCYQGITPPQYTLPQFLHLQSLPPPQILTSAGKASLWKRRSEIIREQPSWILAAEEENLKPEEEEKEEEKELNNTQVEGEWVCWIDSKTRYKQHINPSPPSPEW